MAIRFRRVITFGTHDRMVHHGWLTRIAPGAALGGRTRIVANVWLRFARANRFTTTADLRQPLLVHGLGSLKNNDIRGAQTHVHESREPSARRGTGVAPVTAIGLRRVISFTTHDRMVHHGWLTRIAPGAALGGRMRIIANVRLRFARAIRFTTTAGLSQPLLVGEAGSLKNNDIRGAQTHVLQERRVPARRGSVTCRACRARRTMFGDHRLPHQERRASARRGTGITPAAPSVCCRTRMFACHGGLTPPALVLACECPPAK
jgi:hypothetical protein